MPSITAFGDLDFSDREGIEQFLQAHAAAHTSLQQAAQNNGYAFADTNLNSYPDDDWHARHINVHNQLSQLIQPDPTINVNALSDYDWSSAASFYPWMQIHTLLHQKLEQWKTSTVPGGGSSTYYLTNDAGSQDLTSDSGTQLTSQ